MERSALSGILTTAFGGKSACIANKGYYGTLNEGQEELCEFWFNNGRPNFEATPGTCDDGGYPLCSDKSRPACAKPQTPGSLFCSDGSQPVCKGKKPPLCSDGRPVPVFGQDQGKGSVFSNAGCASACTQDTGLCVSKQDRTDIFKLMMPPAMMMTPPSSSTDSSKPKTGAEAGKTAGAEAAKAAFRRTDTAFRKVFEDGTKSPLGV